MLSSRSNGNTDCAINSDSGHPGRSGCGTSSWASTATASTAFVDGAITPVRMLRVATSTAIVSSARRVTPSAYRQRMSMVFVSICTCSPGRSSTGEVNGRSGRLSCVRRVVAAPKVCRPRSSSAANRYNSRSLGICRASPCAADQRRPHPDEHRLPGDRRPRSPARSSRPASPTAPGRRQRPTGPDRPAVPAPAARPNPSHRRAW